MRHQPIENHGIVGNMHSAALVSLDGSVDWLCPPRFESPSVFGAILDADKGGRFRIAPAAAGALRHKQTHLALISAAFNLDRTLAGRAD